MARVGGLIGGRYRVTRRLGGGGFGEVYEATHAGTHERAALKLLRAELQTQKDAVERFTAEARVSAGLRHPNTVRVFDFGTTEAGDLYLAMELLEGQPLQELLEHEGRLEPKRAVRIAIQVLKSLHEAHGRGLVHRDLKPDNIFLCEIAGESDFVKVIDFGIAKMLREGAAESVTKSGATIGTPHFMSPEQIRAERIDGRADLYSLGIVLYRCLTGRLPFDATTVMAIAMAHVLDAPKPMNATVPGVDPALEGIVMRVLAKERSKRFDSAAAMREALEAWLERFATPVQAPIRTDFDAPFASNGLTPAVAPMAETEYGDEKRTTPLEAFRAPVPPPPFSLPDVGAAPESGDAVELDEPADAPAPAGANSKTGVILLVAAVGVAVALVAGAAMLTSPPPPPPPPDIPDASVAPIADAASAEPTADADSAPPAADAASAAPTADAESAAAVDAVAEADAPQVPVDPCVSLKRLSNAWCSGCPSQARKLAATSERQCACLRLAGLRPAQCAKPPMEPLPPAQPAPAPTRVLPPTPPPRAPDKKPACSGTDCEI